MKFYQKIKITAILALSFIGISLTVLSYAAPPAGQGYPYKAGAGGCGANSDAVAVGTVDQCVPFNAIQNITGQTCNAGYHLISVPSGLPGGKTFYCTPDTVVTQQGGISNITCPANTNVTVDTNGNYTGCQTVTDAGGCPNVSDRIKIYSDGRILCKVTPTSITGETGAKISNSCDTGYKPDSKGACKTGDFITSCPPNGNLCVTPLVTGAEKITQTVHSYQTKYTIPCQPLAGGQCADEQTPAGYIARLYQFGLMIVGLFAFAGIIYGALKYVLSAGNMADQSDAKDQITQAVLGMLLLLGSFLILYTINPEITNIRNPNLEVINIKNIIKSGQADNAVNQQIPTGTAGSGDSLCKLAINGQIGFSVGADTSNSDVLGSPLFNTSGVNLPSGNQSGSRCISCKDNATKGSNGVCACNSGYSSYNGECLKPCTSGETTNCVPNAVMAGPLTCKSGTAEFDGKCISNADCLKNGAFQVVSAPIPGASSSLLVTYKCVPK